MSRLHFNRQFCAQWPLMAQIRRGTKKYVCHSSKSAKCQPNSQKTRINYLLSLAVHRIRTIRRRACKRARIASIWMYMMKSKWTCWRFNFLVLLSTFTTAKKIVIIKVFFSLFDLQRMTVIVAVLFTSKYSDTGWDPWRYHLQHFISIQK